MSPAGSPPTAVAAPSRPWPPARPRTTRSTSSSWGWRHRRGHRADAATRGLSTVIVEAQDWAAGTSSWSSKLVHGGLRYLQMLDFHLVHEALTERDRLISFVAPHLCARSCSSTR